MVACVGSLGNLCTYIAGRRRAISNLHEMGLQDTGSVLSLTAGACATDDFMLVVLGTTVVVDIPLSRIGPAVGVYVGHFFSANTLSIPSACIQKKMDSL